MKHLVKLKRSFSLRGAVCLLLPLLFLLAATGLYAKTIKGRALYKYSNKRAVYGGKFRSYMTTLPRSLDPHQETAAGTTNVTCQLYNTLIRLKQDMRGVELDLAKSWKMKNNNTYIFKLRKGVRFHDRPPVNGRELTSADVKYSFERIMGEHGKKPNFKHRYYFEGKIASIDTPDKYTVIFKTKKPYAAFVNYIASTWCPIVPKEAVDKWGDLKKDGLGTGAFILKEYVMGSHLTYVKNPNYFKKGMPYLDSVNTKYMKDINAVLAAYFAGKLDFIGIYPWQLKTFKEKAPKDVIRESPGIYMWTFRMPPHWKGKIELQKPYDNKKVRQAVAMAIDKKKLLKLAWFGRGDLCVGPVPVKAMGKLSQRYQPKYNPEKAKKLLAQAGYPNGFKAEMITWNAPYMTGPMQILKSMLGKVGIDVTLKPMEFGQYFNVAYKFKYQMALHIMTSGVDPEEWLVPYYGKPEESTYYKWSNPELHSMIAKQTHIMNKRKRAALIKKIQLKVIDESPNLFLYTIKNTWALKPYVHEKYYYSDIQTYLEFMWMSKH